MKVKLKSVKARDVLKADSGFTCMSEGDHIVKESPHGLYLDCDEGRHYLSGQEDEDGNLVGLSK